jgi:spore maturation protein CgeB
VATERRVPQRVLIVGNEYDESVGGSYRRTLRSHCEVRIVDPTRVPLSAHLPARSKTVVFTALKLLSNATTRDPYAWNFGHLIRAAQEFSPDFILISHITILPPKVIARLRQAAPGALVVGVFSDAIINLERGYFFLAEYDALFFKDHYMVDKFRSKLGWKHVFYLPQACDPELHHPIELSDDERRVYGCDLTIAGNMHMFRAAQLAPLAERDLKIWGAPPPAWLDHPIMRRHQHRFVAGDEKCKAMVGAKIVLNNNHFSEIAGTNKRTFEVAAMGAFQLTDTPALADVFEPDVEVASYDSLPDMLEKVEHYLERAEIRQQMAQRARRRAVAEHTFAHRWAAKMDVLGLDVPRAFPVQCDQVKLRAR